MDKSFLVISAMGSDRPGIVDEFSRFVLERNCGIEDSRMAVLGREFAFVALLSGNTDGIQQVRSDIDMLAGKSGLIVTEKMTTRPASSTAPDQIPFRLLGTGMDHPGVVQRFSRFLHERGINIGNLETHAYNAPVTGTPLFHFEMVIEVPSSLPVSAFQDALEGIADEENVDVEFAPVALQ
ncbi:MAG: transcriptional regulator [Armatimonadetes bacterium CG07_land_8_20_14_0_80_59_28]|nr:MAG: transcriptional regulator [Armatimonadetes bacterium CG07_land_8_20_14_0_80_59_28]PIX45880.1 MAG: transcriptional regulator [Armatimonadetes bacterium CG_4_8_14_3_um_filter_58_9]PIY39550.1 MAG: transcriptional regulator [Armatimonadetes bacterium CG_4_10_14_3_um_filter_59_10]